jgi:DNA-binding winged helix-turn-helix (wHTH) protein
MLDTGRREFLRGATPVALEPQVFDLLEFLIRNRDRVVTKHDLFTHIWGGRIVSDSALTTRVNAARSAIGDSGREQRLIKTLLRKGLHFIGTVQEQDERPAGAMSRGTAPEPLSAPTRLAPPDAPSIAVFPFRGHEISGDFADGIAEGIRLSLASLHELLVVSRSSTLVFRGTERDPTLRLAQYPRVSSARASRREMPRTVPRRSPRACPPSAPGNRRG